MRNFLIKIRELIRRRKILSGVVILILLLLVGTFVYGKIKSGSTSVQYQTSTVQKGMLTVSVSGTGQVSASEQVSLKPQVSGTISSVRVKENQEVKAGDVIAVIDQTSAANDVAKAKASLEQAQASYDKLVSGATNNEIATQNLTLKTAQQSLDQAKADYDNTITTQKRTVDKAYTTYLNSGLALKQSDNATTATLTLSGSYSGTEEGKYSISVYTGSGGIYYSASGLGTESGQMTRGVSVPLGHGLYGTWSTTGELYTSTIWTLSVPNAESASYTTNLDAYKTALDSQKQAVDKAKNAVTSAENSYEKTRLQVEDTLAPASSTDLASSQAQVTSARAQLSNAYDAYDNTVIKAPFDGVIADLTVDAGDEASSGTSIATIITKQQVATISLNEVDAAKVKVGDLATVTFSAVSDLTISGKVGDVDNIGTVSQNVVNFSAKVVFDTQSDLVKPGMSASVDIITDSAQDALIVPSAAVKMANNQSYVLVLVNGAPEQRIVTAGLSNDTETVITGDNIQENDEVVTKTVTSSSSSNSSSGNILQSLLGGNRTKVNTSSSSSSSSSSTKTTTGSNASGTVIQFDGPPPGGF
jgi:HlyD family secretion protein